MGIKDLDRNPDLVTNLPFYTIYQEQVLKNDAYFLALMQDLKKAKKSIDLSTYIYKADSLGTKISALLSEAARRGINVRLLLDGFGSRFFDAAHIKELKLAGVNVRIYHPLPWLTWQWANKTYMPHRFLYKIYYLFTKLNSRSHQKLCLIDNEIIYVSNANIDECHLSKKNNEQGWRDTSVRIIGTDTSVLQVALDYAYHPNKINKQAILSINGTHANFYLKFSRAQRKKNYKDLLMRLAICQKRIWITTPYFLPDTRMLKVLKKASQRQIDVRILLPKESDVYISKLVANTFYPQLLKHNIKIYEYDKSILHAKKIIIDDWFLVGSSNFNTRSVKHDLEVDVNIITPDAKNLLEEHFLTDLQNSKQISLQDIKRQSWLKTILGKLFLFARYWI